MITLTPAAAEHFRQVIAQKGSGQGVRIAIKKTGCNGYMYDPQVINEVEPSDVLIPTDYSFTLVVAGDCIDMVKGTVVDYVAKTLGQKILVFQNPNAASECGCGESFNLKEEESEK